MAPRHVLMPRSTQDEVSEGHLINKRVRNAAEIKRGSVFLLIPQFSFSYIYYCPYNLFGIDLEYSQEEK